MSFARSERAPSCIALRCVLLVSVSCPLFVSCVFARSACSTSCLCFVFRRLCSARRKLNRALKRAACSSSCSCLVLFALRRRAPKVKRGLKTRLNLLFVSCVLVLSLRRRAHLLFASCVLVSSLRRRAHYYYGDYLRDRSPQTTPSPTRHHPD